MIIELNKQGMYDAKYDILKFFLSIAIVAIHSSLFPMLLYPWLRIAVPIFFMITAFFLFSKLYNAPIYKEKKIILNFVRRNVRLYISWFVILLPITLYVRKSLYFGNDIIDNIWNIITSFVFSSTFIASWYISASVIGVLIVYYLCKFIKNDYFVFLISFALFCVVSIQSSYSSIIVGTFFGDLINKYLELFGSLVCSWPAAVLWIFLGKCFAEKKINISFKYMHIIICILLLYLEWRYVMNLDGAYNNDSYFLLFPLCMFLFDKIVKNKKIDWDYSYILRRVSTVIYVSHGSIVPVINTAFIMIFSFNCPIVTFIITLICCILLYLFIELLNRKCNKSKIKIFIAGLY